EKIVDAVESRPVDLFVAGRHEDQVSLRLVSFLPIADEIRDENRHHRLVVERASGIEEAVFLDQLERVAFPLLALRLDDVEMAEQHDRLPAAAAPVARHEIAFPR